MNDVHELKREADYYKSCYEAMIRDESEYFGKWLMLLTDKISEQNRDVALYGKTSTEATYARLAVNTVVDTIKCFRDLDVRFYHESESVEQISAIQMYMGKDKIGVKISCNIWE